MTGKLSPVLTGKLVKDLRTADGTYMLPAGTLVEFQFSLDTDVRVCPKKFGAQRCITASLKEIVGSELVS